MLSSLGFLLWLAAGALPWSELDLSVEPDLSVSSDHATLVRVRVFNRGPRTYPGRDLRFEVRAIDGGIVVARQRGRFGLSLPPRGTLETIVGFEGRYGRFEVVPLEAGTAHRKRKRRDETGPSADR
jgi:hypothetical protein